VEGDCPHGTICISALLPIRTKEPRKNKLVNS
jgi:hypothetical protein